jgi:flagellar hook assembly protein FlgD
MENAYPNPFNPQTYIAYRLSENTDVNITVFDMLGRRVKTLFDGRQPAGSYHVYWNGTTETGSRAPSGGYIIRMETENMKRVQKITLVK